MRNLKARAASVEGGNALSCVQGESELLNGALYVQAGVGLSLRVKASTSNWDVHGAAATAMLQSRQFKFAFFADILLFLIFSQTLQAAANTCLPRSLCPCLPLSRSLALTLRLCLPVCLSGSLPVVGNPFMVLLTGSLLPWRRLVC